MKSKFVLLLLAFLNFHLLIPPTEATLLEENRALSAIAIYLLSLSYANTSSDCLFTLYPEYDLGKLALLAEQGCTLILSENPLLLYVSESIDLDSFRIKTVEPQDSPILYLIVKPERKRGISIKFPEERKGIQTLVDLRLLDPMQDPYNRSVVLRSYSNSQPVNSISTEFSSNPNGDGGDDPGWSFKLWKWMQRHLFSCWCSTSKDTFYNDPVDPHLELASPDQKASPVLSTRSELYSLEGTKTKLVIPKSLPLRSPSPYSDISILSGNAGCFGFCSAPTHPTSRTTPLRKSLSLVGFEYPPSPSPTEHSHFEHYLFQAHAVSDSVNSGSFLQLEVLSPEAAPQAPPPSLALDAVVLADQMYSPAEEVVTPPHHSAPEPECSEAIDFCEEVWSVDENLPD
ncbi:hypothetical protein [Endozoicomonas arenosclerae]|uniref:hypothetical protein n=1 Tax=Endozoicomonas arenosclerae TaxID=1633495 RepID=UPI00078156FF|nr:hypothetical protein [Endozoicomonas arenosclerae]